jgi:phosphoadenosine phosphosulfate reductase
LVQYSSFESATAQEVLSWALSTFGDSLAISTSFQKEGMVVIDLAARTGQPFRVFTLDTGRLPEETLQMMETVRGRWGVSVEAVSPDLEEVARMVERHGRNLFYESVELRQLCCDVRKVRPIERKLREFDAWATGMRREQSETRAQVAKVAFVDGRIKISPLADWTAAQVDDYTRRNDLPVHPFYSRGYTSIGCAPCTRPVREGEDERAGRWWWEIGGKKECGIHFEPDGLRQRAS